MPDRVRSGGRVSQGLRRSLLLLLLFLVVGALSGIVWEWLWSPPTGVAVDGEFRLDGEGLRSSFSGTALFVLVGVVSGVLLGVLAALTADGWEVLTLVLVVVGSALAVWLMHLVGTSLGPPDPGSAAAGAEDLTRLRDDLSVSAWSAFTALPSGALVGLVVVFVGMRGRAAPR